MSATLGSCLYLEVSLHRGVRELLKRGAGVLTLMRQRQKLKSLERWNLKGRGLKEREKPMKELGAILRDLLVTFGRR